MSQIHKCNDGTTDVTDKGTRHEACANHGGEVPAPPPPLFTYYCKDLTAVHTSKNQPCANHGGFMKGQIFQSENKGGEIGKSLTAGIGKLPVAVWYGIGASVLLYIAIKQKWF
jgi:hypothetical protein